MKCCLAGLTNLVNTQITQSLNLYFRWFDSLSVINFTDKSIEELPGALLNAVDSYWNKRVEVDQVLYLYLVDEYTMQPVEGDNYPIAIRKSKHSEFLECALPLLQVIYSHVTLFSSLNLQQ